MRRSVFITLAALLAISCQTTSRTPDDSKPSLETSRAKAQTVTQANTYLGADLLAALSQNETGNIFISPLSLSTAMGMLYAGAEGDTKTTIANVMYYPETSVHTELGKLRETADRRIEPVNYGSGQSQDPQILAINNSLWVDNSFRLKASYLQTLRQAYNVLPTKVDFFNHPNASRLRINDWVEDRTNDKIKDLLSRDDVTENTAIILVNTVYMMAHWQNIFNEQDTQDLDFWVNGHRMEKRALMEQELYLKQAKLEKTRSIEIPYANDMSMVVILPPKETGLKKLNDELSHKRFKAHLEALKTAEPVNTDLRLPKFSLKARYKLTPALKTLGMENVFLPSLPNLSAMTDDSRAAISGVIQQVFLDVNEKGTEAAAATAVTVVTTSAGPPAPKPKAFHVDRPFILLLKDNKTDSIAFMGRITNPEPAKH